MKNLKAIMASVIMLVAVMVMALGSQDVEAKQSISNSDDWRVMADDSFCYNNPWNCPPKDTTVIVER